MLASTLRTALARSHSRTPVLASHLARAAATAATGTPSSAAAMQPATADDRPNIIADLKRDHASFFALHRRYSSELGLDQNDKQVIIWQARAGADARPVRAARWRRARDACALRAHP
jgi:hypothetical protein